MRQLRLAGRIAHMREFSVAAETARLQCLQALGITVYVPRVKLQGAAPSPQWPHAANPDEHAEPEQASASVSQPPVAPRVEAVPRVQQVGARRAAETSAEPVVAFQLLFLQIDDDLAILNQIPALARPQLQDRQRLLLGNMLHWLGKSLPQQGTRVFRWPLPGLESLAGGMQSSTNVLHFLEQASAERGFRFLLMLGPQAAVPQAPGWHGLATHSLDEMLALPSLKREAWQTLLPLHAQLRGTIA
jgi:hypothetical protein